MTIDAHLHIWDRERSPYAWLDGADTDLARTHDLAEAFAQLRPLGVSEAILVQADETLDETAFLLETAAADDRIRGVVAYLPLDDEVRLRESWLRFGDDPYLRGVRTLSHDRDDEQWILTAAVQEGIATVAANGLPLDYVAVTPGHLRNVPELARRNPGLRIVIDHLAKPPFGADVERWRQWRDGLAAAASHPDVFAKISGLYAGDQGEGTRVEDAVKVAIELFGADRLMLGSDWPVCVPEGGADRALSSLSSAVDAHADDSQRDAIARGTAERVYAGRS